MVESWGVRISRIWWSPGGARRWWSWRTWQKCEKPPKSLWVYKALVELEEVEESKSGPPKTLWIQKELAELDELAEM